MSANSPSQADREWLLCAFRQFQITLENELNLAKVIRHPGDQGGVSEDRWLEVFRRYLPNRYQVDRGTVIDNFGRQSDSIDVVIFDRHYTPTLLDQENHRYIPAEAVYAVMEAKPEFTKDYLEYAGKKAASVRKLHRTSVAIAHAGGEFKPKEHFEIVSGIIAPKSSWSDGLGASFQKNLPNANSLERIDCGCALAHGAFDFFDGATLRVVPAEGALIFFLFRLLGKLQSLGTVPAIDWTAYASIFEGKKAVPRVRGL